MLNYVQNLTSQEDGIFEELWKLFHSNLIDLNLDGQQRQNTGESCLFATLLSLLAKIQELTASGMQVSEARCKDVEQVRFLLKMFTETLLIQVSVSEIS